MPFFMLGYPDKDSSLALIKTAIDAGADALELGIPFSDPIADGPVIESAARTALAAGVDFAVCCEMLSEIRKYSDMPIGLLVYYNLLVQQDDSVYPLLQQLGVDAVLAVDLPIEESAHHEAMLAENHIGSVQLIAPNSDEVRSKDLLSHCTAFAYVVSRYGTTGTSEVLSDTLPARLQKLHAIGNCPLVVGFGISTAEQVKSVFDSGADGAIIGSQITKWIANDSIAGAKDKIKQLISEVKSC